MCDDLWVIALALTKTRARGVRSLKSGECSYEVDVILLERWHFVMSGSQLTASLPLVIAVVRLIISLAPQSLLCFSSVPLRKHPLRPSLRQIERDNCCKLGSQHLYFDSLASCPLNLTIRAACSPNLCDYVIDRNIFIFRPVISCLILGGMVLWFLMQMSQIHQERQESRLVLLWY